MIPSIIIWAAIGAIGASVVMSSKQRKKDVTPKAMAARTGVKVSRDCAQIEIVDRIQAQETFWAAYAAARKKGGSRPFPIAKSVMMALGARCFKGNEPRTSEAFDFFMNIMEDVGELLRDDGVLTSEELEYYYMDLDHWIQRQQERFGAA